MNIKIVNINNIEDLVLSKYEIETFLIKENIIEKKMELTEFINNYAITDYVYLINDKIIPFNLKRINDINYLFVSNNNEEDLNLLLNKVKLMKYDIDNKIEVDLTDILINSKKLDSVIIHNKKYYK